MKRLAPNKETLRNLGIRSKNQCAFPGCNHPILNENGVYIAQLCHIEAALPGGPRYNLEQTNEERRSYENLLFLCYRHHRETDNVEKYTVEHLRKIKAEHEAGSEVELNVEALANQVEAVVKEQEEIKEILKSGVANSQVPDSFEIIGPDLQSAWTPEEGRFYEYDSDRVKYKFVLKDGWLHIEQTLADGAVQYFEVNKEGSARIATTAYPISEYKVEIPAHMILTQIKESSEIGTHSIFTTLKWSSGTVREHFNNDEFLGADVKARAIINQQKRLIKIVDILNA